MHDTAFDIGGLVIKKYRPSPQCSILEIGSLDVNGSLRRHADPSDDYVGLDFTPGDGVDFVIEPHGDWPITGPKFDIVIASSVFEHDPSFWITFLEMVRRAKPGGIIYLNAPSNGSVHRYPYDCWRFYPDAGSALVSWARKHDIHLRLVESFVSERKADIWNDFCAIFRREPCDVELATSLVCDEVACTNVTTWKSLELTNRRDETQDMVLIREGGASRREIEVLSSELSDARRNLSTSAVAESLASALGDKLSEANGVILSVSKERMRSEADLEHASARAASAEGKLVTTVAQFERQSDLLAREMKRLAALEGDLRIAKVARLAAEASRDDRFAEIAKLVELLDLAHIRQTHAEETLIAERHSMSSASEEQRIQLDSVLAEKVTLESSISERYTELAEFTQVFLETQALSRDAVSKSEWIREAFVASLAIPKWWQLLPRFWRQKLLNRYYTKQLKFDGQDYLKRYPDVAKSGIAPLTHYIKHGIGEGRAIRIFKG